MVGVRVNRGIDIGRNARVSEPGSAPAPSDPATSTGLLERPATETQTEEGDHERFAHYVRKDRIVESAVTGRPVIALCGKVWVPGRDPSRFPVCPACKAIFESINPPKPPSDS
jgi:hypothetical protein